MDVHAIDGLSLRGPVCVRVGMFGPGSSKSKTTHVGMLIVEQLHTFAVRACFYFLRSSESTKMQANPGAGDD